MNRPGKRLAMIGVGLSVLAATGLAVPSVQASAQEVDDGVRYSCTATGLPPTEAAVRIDTRPDSVESGGDIDLGPVAVDISLAGWADALRAQGIGGTATYMNLAVDVGEQEIPIDDLIVAGGHVHDLPDGPDLELSAQGRGAPVHLEQQDDLSVSTPESFTLVVETSTAETEMPKNNYLQCDALDSADLASIAADDTGTDGAIWWWTGGFVLFALAVALTIRVLTSRRVPHDHSDD